MIMVPFQFSYQSLNMFSTELSVQLLVSALASTFILGLVFSLWSFAERTWNSLVFSSVMSLRWDVLRAVAFLVSVLSAKSVRRILCPTSSWALRSASRFRCLFRACASCSRDFLFRLDRCEDPSDDDDSSEFENVDGVDDRAVISSSLEVVSDADECCDDSGLSLGGLSFGDDLGVVSRPTVVLPGRKDCFKFSKKKKLVWGI